MLQFKSVMDASSNLFYKFFHAIETGVSIDSFLISFNLKVDTKTYDLELILFKIKWEFSRN